MQSTAPSLASSLVSNTSAAPPDPLPPRAVDLIVLHCSATPGAHWLGGAGPGDAGYRTAPAVIDDWHRARGFQRASAARAGFNWRLAHIGYHYVVDVDGNLWTGRHRNEIGAHVAGHNETSLGICIVGGAEREACYLAAQWETLGKLVRLMRHHYPHARVCGHRDLSPDSDADGAVQPREWLKTCPGFDVAAWLESGMQPLAQHVAEEVAL